MTVHRQETGSNWTESPVTAGATPSAPRRFTRALTWRSAAICVVLLPLNSYWVMQMEVVRYSAHPTTISILFNTVFLLFVFTCLNQLVACKTRLTPLTRAELLLVYAILCIGSCVGGHDFLEILVPMLSWPYKHASASNNWLHLIIPHLNPHFFVTNPAIYKTYYTGNDTIWRVKYVRAWLPVVLIWTGFVALLLWVFICINAILRKQWTDHERLTYPIVQVPLIITNPAAFQTGGLFRNRLFWIGFAIAAGIDIINSINYYYPSVPTVLTPGFGQSFTDIGQFVTSKPWNAIGWTPISFYPFMIGLGMFMPLDFLFSCVFFYWMWKMEDVAAVALALDHDPLFPYTQSQSFGAYMSFCFFAIWISRRYLRDVVLCALGRPSPLDDSLEPMRYRWAIVGIVIGFSGLVIYSMILGMSWWLAIAFFVMYFALAVAITRMRAELGTPIHDLHFTGPDQVLTRVGGTKVFSTSNLTVMSLYFWFNRAYRGHAMPQQLEAYKMAEQTRSDYRRWHIAMVVLSTLAIFIAFWAMLFLMYHYGAEAKSKLTFGSESYDQLQGWLNTPAHGNFQQFMAICVGFGIAFLLQWLRTRFPWWPLHPLAFAVTSSWEINLVWGPLFLAWIFKSLILRYGGRRGFHRALPFFVGLMLGQFTVGSLLNIFGIIRGLPTYQFWQ
ncbi:MAG: hypothetical protein KGJ62_07100 [Armatimonadetes bacterium]|nr:hypothetical protein [Armatimonadota bacterium]MDE2207299.1 hypothetical protein [Armatimonadota bacterium]